MTAGTFPILAAYLGDPNPICTSVFVPGRGWHPRAPIQVTPKVLRQLRKASVTSVAFPTKTGGEADFKISELLGRDAKPIPTFHGGRRS